MVSMSKRFLEEVSELYQVLSCSHEDSSKNEFILFILYVLAVVYISFEKSIDRLILLSTPFLSREIIKRRSRLGALKYPLALSFYPLALGLATTFFSVISFGERGLLEGISLTLRSVLSTLILALYIERVGLIKISNILGEIGVPRGVLVFYEHVLLTAVTLSGSLIELLGARESRTLRKMSLREIWKHQFIIIESFMYRVRFRLEQKSMALQARGLR